MIASNAIKGAICLLADEQLVILIHRAHPAIAVQDGVARNVPSFLQLEEQILRRLVTITWCVDLKLATAATLTRLDLTNNYVVLEIQGLDPLQLVYLDGSCLKAEIPAPTCQNRER